MFANSVFRLSLLLVVVSVVAMLAQASHEEQFPGNYPAFDGPIDTRYEVAADSVTLHVGERMNGLRVLVFAYDERGMMFAILKQVENGAIVVNRGDYADVEVATKGRQVMGYELLKHMDHYAHKTDMYELLKKGEALSLRHGVQRCLFPLCTRCIDGCKSVISGGDIPLQMEVAPGGQIHPVYARGKCPRCGKCFTWCPVGVITNSRPGKG